MALHVGLGGFAWGDGLRDAAARATDAFSSQDYKRAMPMLASLAADGDPAADCMVTIMLDRTHGRVSYDADGLAATCVGAAEGEAPAELDLAYHYRTGTIVGRDVVMAAMLYRRAADQGSAVAQKVLGDFYAEGTGVKRDLAAACRWWGRAAVQGQSSEAERNYGNCYLTGTAVPRSDVQALAWWLIAKNNEKDDRSLPAWVFQGDVDGDRLSDALIQRLPADQAAEAQALARAWQPKPE